MNYVTVNNFVNFPSNFPHFLKTVAQILCAYLRTMLLSRFEVLQKYRGVNGIIYFTTRKVNFETFSLFPPFHCHNPSC